MEMPMPPGVLPPPLTSSHSAAGDTVTDQFRSCEATLELTVTLAGAGNADDPTASEKESDEDERIRSA